MESLSWRQSTYSRTSSDDSLYLPMENHRSSRHRRFSARNSSDDSLHVPVNNSQTIKRWNGISREAINWNALPRDPELFFPTGNCLVYLYPAGHSQRGPSFRIPYHILLYSGCQPLVQQCLVSQLNISSPDHVTSNPLSHGSVEYSVSQDTRSYLYLYPPAAMSRDESYSYHITTRNFFAWLLGVPLVGTDPVSALMDLKARMDIWRGPNANNFEAIFEYARQQAYGDFEEIQIEMEKRTESRRTPERVLMQSVDQEPTRDRQYRHNSGVSRRNDSMKRRLRNSISKSSKTHIASQDMRVEQVPTHLEKRQPLPRLTTFPSMPIVPSTDEVDGAIRRPSGPARAQSSHAVSPIQGRETPKAHRHTSSSTSNSPVSPMTPVDSNGIDAALKRLTGPPSTESVATVNTTKATKLTKKKNRVSWADNNPTNAEARSSQTDLTYPNMQGLGLQSAQASSSAINVSQTTPLARRSLTSLPLYSQPLSSHPVAGLSKRSSLPANTGRTPWGEDIRVARPMSTASLISIPTMSPANTPVNFEPCSCCGKIRRPDTSLSQQPRPFSVASPEPAGKQRRPDNDWSQSHNQLSRPASSVIEPCSCCGKIRRPDTNHTQQPRPSSVTSPELSGKQRRSENDWSQAHNKLSRPASSVIEPCSCCGKLRRPDTSSSQSQHLKQPRPTSVRSMKSFRSTKSWRSLRSVRSSLSLRSIRSFASLSSIRAYLSSHRAAKRSTSFADIKTDMKDRRATFRARLSKEDKKGKKRALEVDTGNYNNSRVNSHSSAPPQSCNPNDYTPPRPTTGYNYRHTSQHTPNSAPVELEAEPVSAAAVATMQTVPELEPSNPWSPESYSDTPYTPEDERPTTTIRPKEIYTSGAYRHAPQPRRPRVDVQNLMLRLPDDGGDGEREVGGVLDIGTPGGFEEDFVDTLIKQLEAAGIGEGVPREGKGKGRMDEEGEVGGGGGMWMRSAVGVPRLEVGAMG